MRENCLVAIQSKTGDGTSGLQADDAFAMMRKELESFADIMLTSRPKDRTFWLGEQSGADREFIEKTYRALKPCLHGSDAHSEEAIGIPAHERLCWLKGDLTFETLRQAVVEPGERVWIGAAPPAQAIPALTIRQVGSSNAPWMKKASIELNGGLVAIIGARGSGKTALADIAAIGAHAIDAGTGDASFLKRATLPVDHLGGAVVELTWGDNSKTGGSMRPTRVTDEPEAVRYLSQHFVEKLCSAAGLATELRRAMERVVFESTDPLDRLEAEGFDDLAERRLEPIRTTYADLQVQIDTIGDAIVHEDILRDGLQKLTRERDALAKKIGSSKAEQQKLIPKGNDERAKLLAALETACTAAQGKVESLRLRLKTIDDLAAAATYLVGTAENTRFAAMQQKFALAQLTADEWNAFKLRFAGETAAAVASAKARADNAVALALNGDPTVTIDIAVVPHAQWPLNLLKAERDKLKAAVGIDADRKRKYDEARFSVRERIYRRPTLDRCVKPYQLKIVSSPVSA
jgi:hypothetical protein